MNRLFTLFLLLSTALSMNAQTTWDNFQDQRKGTYGFISGTFIPYFENPDKTGANTSDVAAQYTRNPAEPFDVIILDAAMADLSEYISGTKSISIDVWSPNAGIPIQITMENNTLAQPANFPTGRHSVYLTSTTVANAWETLTFTFDNQPDPTVANDNVDRLVLLFNPNTNTGDTYYWDNLNGPELADDPCEGVMPSPVVLNDFECDQNVDYIFSHSGVNFRRILNPDPSGVNTSEYVATYTRNGGEENDVIIGRFDGNLNLASDSEIQLDVWDPGAPTTVTLSLQNNDNNVILAVDAETTTSSQWETLTFDVGSVFDAPDISQFVILFDPGNFTSDNYFFDNFQLDEAVAIEELEQLTQFSVFPNPVSDHARFEYQLSDAAQVSVLIRDARGQVVATVFEGEQRAGYHQLQWNPGDLPNGPYFYQFYVDGATAGGQLMLTR